MDSSWCPCRCHSNSSSCPRHLGVWCRISSAAAFVSQGSQPGNCFWWTVVLSLSASSVWWWWLWRTGNHLPLVVLLSLKGWSQPCEEYNMHTWTHLFFNHATSGHLNLTDSSFPLRETLHIFCCSYTYLAQTIAFLNSIQAEKKILLILAKSRSHTTNKDDLWALWN